MCVLENPAITDGSKLLLIRDSYSDSLAPFLAQRFSEVHLVDLRYYHTSVADYMAEQGIDTAVVLYSVSVLDKRSLIEAGRALRQSVLPDLRRRFYRGDGGLFCRPVPSAGRLDGPESPVRAAVRQEAEDPRGQPSLVRHAVPSLLG